MRKLSRRIANLQRLPGLASQVLRWHPKSALKGYGWFRSFHKCAPQLADGKPIPWFTYAAYELIKERLPARISVFEFGTGNSTRWFAARDCSLWGVESSEQWSRRVREWVPEARIETHTVQDAYVRSVFASGKKFDLVVVDGVFRPECLMAGVQAVSEAGVVILDDSERAEYSPAVEAAVAQGFRELPLWGLRPGVVHRSKTSVLYRQGNILGL